MTRIIKSILLASAVLTIVFGTVFSTQAQSKTNNWQTFSPEEDNFSVLMPSMPQVIRQEISNPLGLPNVIQTKWVVADKGGLIAYGVLSQPTCPLRTPEMEKGIMAQGIQEWRAQGAQILNLRGISLSGNSGLAHERHFFDGRMFQERQYIVKTRLYTLTVYYPNREVELANLTERDKFFDSFKLVSTRTHTIEGEGIKIQIPLGLSIQDFQQNSLLLMEDCTCLNIFTAVFEAKTFEEAWKNANEKLPALGKEGFKKTQGGVIKGMQYNRYIGTNMDARIVKVAESKFLIMFGGISNSIGKLTVEPFYKDRLAALYEGVFNSIEKINLKERK